MGLDSVELVMAVEEDFGIEIPNAVCETLTTPRQVADYVYSLHAGEPAGCYSQAAFYHLRGALVRLTGVRRRDVRLETRLAGMLPRRGIRELWSALESAIGARVMPRLRAPRHVKLWLILATVALALLLACLRVSQSLYLLACFAMLVADQVLLMKFSTLIPAGVETVRMLVPHVTLPERQAWNFDEVLQRVMLITAEQSGVAPGKFGPDDRFIEDIVLC